MRPTERQRNEDKLQRLEEGARQAGVKLTHQRLEIFRELAHTEAHPDAETLFRAVQKRVPTVSLDTVYRTLWKLHELGLVHTLGPRQDAIRFDANLEPHHHFTCIDCGLVRDFHSDELSGMRLPSTVKSLGTIMDSRVEVRGVCADCSPRRKQHKRS